MFREIYKVITTVVRELLFSLPTFILHTQPPVAPLPSHLLRAAGRGMGGIIRDTKRVSTEFVFSQYRV